MRPKTFRPCGETHTDSRPLISWIFNDEASLDAYHETYDRFISECVESSWLSEEISRVHDMIAPYVESDPSAFYTAEEFEKATDTLKTFCAKRAESIRGQLEGTIPSTTQGQQADSSSLIDAGGPPDGGFPGGGFSSGGGYSTEIWIWTAVCAAVLLAAILIIRKAGDHNS